MLADDVQWTIWHLEKRVRDCRSRQIACVEGWPK
jgi:hypothetical protein